MTRITVMASGSTEPGLDFVAQAFRKETGHEVDIIYNAVLEVFDVLVATREAAEGKYRALVEEGGISIGRLGLGVAVRSGSPLPDVGSVESFKRAFLEAEAILLTTHSSGLYIEEWLKKAKLHEKVEGKILRFDSAPELIARLAGGKGWKISVLSTNQIRVNQDKGVALAGLLPEEVQDFREFVAVPSAASAHKKLAGDFARYCAGPGRPLLSANGFA